MTLQVTAVCLAGRVQLLRGIDRAKDQSYFLASVQPGSFERVMFPLGGFTKAQVRDIALEAGLPVAQRRSSAGICFIGEHDDSSHACMQPSEAPLSDSYWQSGVFHSYYSGQAPIAVTL